MPIYRFGSTMAHLKLSGKLKKNPPPQCPAPMDHPDGSDRRVKCCAMATLLCDFKMPDGKDCDRPMCEEHAQEIGPDQHLCYLHAGTKP